MNLPNLTCFLLAVLSVAQARAVPPATQPDAVQRVLVLPVKTVGISESIGPAVVSGLIAGLSRIQGIEPASIEEFEELLELTADKERLGCEEDTACLVKVTEIANARLVVSSTVGQIGTSLLVSVTLVDASRAAAIERVSETVQDEAALLATVPSLAAKLMGAGPRAAAPKFRLPEGKKLSFGIFDLKATGVSEEIAKNLTQILSSQVSQLTGGSVITGDDVDSMLQLAEEKERHGCLDDMSCMAEVGGALGVDRMVVGHVGKLAERFVVSLRLMNVREASVESRKSVTFRGEEAQLIRAIRHVARGLFGLPTKGAGSLALASDQQGVVVQINGEGRGELPMPPLVDLPAGMQTVRLTKDGYLDWQSDFFIEPGETTPMWASLQETPARWYQKWWVWTAVGAVVVGSVVGAVFLSKSGKAPDPEGTVKPGPITLGGELW